MALEAESSFKFVRMKRRCRAAWLCHVTITGLEAESGGDPEPLLAFGWAQIEFGPCGRNSEDLLLVGAIPSSPMRGTSSRQDVWCP